MMYGYSQYYPAPRKEPEVIEVIKIGGILNLAGIIVRLVYQVKVKYPDKSIRLHWQIAEGSSDQSIALSPLLNERPPIDLAWDSKRKKFNVVTK